MRTFVCDPVDRQWLSGLGVASADGLLKLHPEKIAAISGDTETFEVRPGKLGATAGPEQVFVKRYRYRSLRAMLLGFYRGMLFGRSRARIEFETLAEMRRRNLRVVRPIAYAEIRRCGFLQACVLVTEGEQNTETLGPYYSSRAPSWDESTRRRFVRAVARCVAALHDAGVLHGGLYWRNILVREEGDKEWTFTILDPNRRCALFQGPAPLKARIADLSDWVASAVAFLGNTDITRFLRSYEQIVGRKDDRKSAIRAIIQAARKKAPYEGGRIAMAVAISWLQDRIEAAASEPDHAIFDSVDALTAAIARADVRGMTEHRCVIRLRLHPPGGGEPRFHTIVLDAEQARVLEGRGDQQPDLVIRADDEALLAIINARPDAFQAVRAGRLGLRGDPRALALLARVVDSGAKAV